MPTETGTQAIDRAAELLARVVESHRPLGVGELAADTGLPKAVLDVYDTPELLLLGCAGLVIAALGALLPASWAAKARTATALRTE